RAADAEGKVEFRSRKPPWLKVPAPGGPTYRRLKKAIEEDNLHTVCQEANCPNVGECWERGTATFMILGDVCTRRCGFCNVQTGVPTWNDPLEPMRVAAQVKRTGLRHAVVTSADRDDLPDYGAGAFVGVIRSIRMLAPGRRVQLLDPDPPRAPGRGPDRGPVPAPDRASPPGCPLLAPRGVRGTRASRPGDRLRVGRLWPARPQLLSRGRERPRGRRGPRRGVTAGFHE